MIYKNHLIEVYSIELGQIINQCVLALQPGVLSSKISDLALVEVVTD